jgi:hypothetical protein
MLLRMANGFLHMDTAGVGNLMDSLADAARDLDRGWQNALGMIQAGEGAIGGDAIGQAIRGAYDQPGREMRAAADRHPVAMMSDADVGHSCAADYVAADDFGRDVLARLFSGPDARS